MNNDEITQDILYGLSHLSNTKHTFILKILFEQGVVSYIMRMDLSANKQNLQNSLRLIGNLLTGDDLMTDQMIQYGVINFLERLLNSPISEIRKEATWSLSNIAAGTKGHINSLINSSAFEKICELVKDPVLNVAREAVWTISNCLSGSDLEICFKMANKGVIHPIIYALIHLKQPSILGVTLEGLIQLFQHGDIVCQLDTPNPFVRHFIENGGLEPLEKLQEHQNMEMFRIVTEIIERYFLNKV